MKSTRQSLTMILLFALGSCGKTPHVSMAPDDCLDLPVYPPAGVVDPRQTVIACVERNAALYAKGPDGALVLAEAVVTKCQKQIMSNVESAAHEAGQEPRYVEVIDAWRKHALPVIAEARARGCFS